MGKSSKCDRDRVSDFSYEGQFLGFTALDGYKLKYLKLSASNRDYIIKIPKEQRLDLYRSLKPGDLIQCTGEQKLNFSTGECKLKAYTISKIANHQTNSEVIHLHSNVRDLNSDRPSSKQHAKSDSKPLVNVLVCQKSDCAKRGSGQICSALMNALEQQDLAEYVKVKGTGCMKHCKSGPHVVVMPDKSRFSHVKVGQIQEIVAEIGSQVSAQTMPKAV
ncbi:(2Fe-2S) ferredoxin domain-containing protein [Pseudanabaena sp. PCC 6802]|uniref:(2Fe-2S) ferredoxin domain-containing protein n=1 Tax=Pseudanabaena sp. PCC 6802 TaxID=118173 RepID=UPI0003491A4D|nr:(2Fe-2S) ferredoxin domain-containing protein [Pseudanabaena sp. PCC 6802]